MTRRIDHLACYEKFSNRFLVSKISKKCDHKSLMNRLVDLVWHHLLKCMNSQDRFFWSFSVKVTKFANGPWYSGLLGENPL